MKLRSKPSRCAGCPLVDDDVNDFVPPSCNCKAPACSLTGDGLKDGYRQLLTESVCSAKVMAVGIAPSREEVQRGKVLCGPSGRILDSALGLDGFDQPLRKLNLVQCRTKMLGANGYVNRDPYKKEIVACWNRWLLPELLAFERRGGELIIPLGALAFEYLLGGHGFGSFAHGRGNRFCVDNLAALYEAPADTI